MSDSVTWSDRAYAGFWLRFVAVLIDALIVTVAWGVLARVLGPPTLFDPATLQPQPGFFGVVGTWFGVSIAVWIVYDTVFVAWLGWTIGKRAVGVEVRGEDGARLRVGRAFVRALVKYTLSMWVLFLGYLWAAWDARKQSWHDKLAGSYALRRSWLQPAVGPEPAPTRESGARQQPPEWTSSPGGWGIPEQQPPGQPGADPDPERQPGTGQPAGREPAPQEPAGQIGDRSSEAPRPSPGPPPGVVEEPTREPPAGPGPAAPPPAGPEPAAEPAPAADPNRVAIIRAGLGQDTAAWLDQVAAQVDPRLDRVASAWRSSPQAPAARACAFGLLLGHLARTYPHMAEDLGEVAEAHPSFSTLLAGSRLATLQQIAQDPERATAWLGPLIGVQEPQQLRYLFD